MKLRAFSLVWALACLLYAPPFAIAKPAPLPKQQMLAMRVYKKATDVSLGGLLWSPDKRWLCYVLTESQRKEEDQQKVEFHTLCCIRADGKGARRIYKGQTPGRSPYGTRWTPNGRNLMFWTVQSPGVSINMDGLPFWDASVLGGKPRLLTKPANPDKDTYMLRNHSFIAFSPDHRFVALTLGDGRFWHINKRIALLNYRTLKRRWLTPPSIAAVQPAWSPDGRSIAYVATSELNSGSLRSGTPNNLYEYPRHLWSVTVDGRRRFQLTRDPNYHEYAPRWRRDGKSLEFVRVRNRDDKASLWRIGANGKGLRRIRELPSQSFGYGNED